MKQDLVISVYKPKTAFAKEFQIKAGTEDTAWAFVRQHLEKVPVVVDADNDGKISFEEFKEIFFPIKGEEISYNIKNNNRICLWRNRKLS